MRVLTDTNDIEDSERTAQYIVALEGDEISKKREKPQLRFRARS